MRRLPPPSVFDLTFAQVERRLGTAAAATVHHQLYRQRVRTSPLIDRLVGVDGVTRVAPLRRMQVTHGAMSTRFLFALEDGMAIETVRIRRRTGMTACVSSQVGCAFGCTFCASGRLGLQRNLRAGEIVQQVLELGPKVNRVVFMGIGEPLHNHEQVLAAIRILRERRGLALRTSGITISTIGIPRRLRQLREEHLKINLTISLHATTDELRHRLIPGSRSFSLADVVRESQRWAVRHNRVVTYVHLLLPGLNDTPDDAERLVGLLQGARARVNLMRWNPVEGGDRFARIDDRGLAAFRRHLERGGLDVTVRDTQGRDIEAACGQLWLRDIGGSS